MRVTDVEVSVLWTTSIMAWLSRWLKLNMIAQNELEVSGCLKYFLFGDYGEQGLICG